MSLADNSFSDVFQETQFSNMRLCGISWYRTKERGGIFVRENIKDGTIIHYID